MKQAIYLILLCAVLALTDCTNRSKPTDDEKTKSAWQQYNELFTAMDMGRALAVIDSMEQAKTVSTAKADYLRGIAYDTGWKMRIAEHFYRKAYENFVPKSSQDWYDYTDAGYRWAYMHFGRGDIEGALDIVTKLLPLAKENEAFPRIIKASLLMLMAECHIQLNQNDEARRYWQKAYELQQQVNKENHETDFPWVSMNICGNLFDIGDVEEAKRWLELAEQEFAQYEQEGDSLIVEEWRGHLALKRALYLQATGHAAEAAATYAAVPHSRIMEPYGYKEAAKYLMDAGRYDEAAYWYEQIDSTYEATNGARMTFDNIALRLSPRYSAYRKAGRNSDALTIADSISAAIDSALVWQKKNDASELAVIYQTHEKELALEESEAKATVYRILAVVAFLICLFVAYMFWWAAQYNKVLFEKNRRLLAEMEQREREQKQAIEQLKAEPEELLTANQKLFRSICVLMNEQKPFTDENLNRDSLAQLLGTNPKYIDQAINECSNGDTTRDFINRYRVQHIATLLKATDDSIGLIGEMSGIASRATLSRLFRDYYGMTPSEYRQAARAELKQN
ncbi:MAG: helix-turn-helix domain-containing protein [Bacteroidales bacterium]|nr:helix-turn-helix domain-containing protein [Bacteroidales bacterium]